ncbi:YqcC family protein [Shewanella donghaensis]|uniref:YqcC family protein n=1 Tax=Shewanella donghaensis TaxID=238836 RepID=UPI001182C290|nr:YqcC family protein [Shewanella donghaensis]
MPYIKTEQYLILIEQKLKDTGLWSANAPSAKALASTSPFACDTLPFEQWIQFIFIKKMKQLIMSHQVLPSKIALAPMAAHVWSQRKDLIGLIGLLAELDTLLGEQ